MSSENQSAISMGAELLGPRDLEELISVSVPPGAFAPGMVTTGYHVLPPLRAVLVFGDARMLTHPCLYFRSCLVCLSISTYPVDRGSWQATVPRSRQSWT